MSHEQTIWMYPNRIYVISGGASANSLFFEDKECHELFYKYMNRFVASMVKVLHYKMTSTSWTMLIQTRSEQKIKDAYYEQRKKSKKANRNKDLKDINRMLSEHFRMFLSLFARGCNAHLGRKGVLVMKRFDKHLITREKDYYREFEKICDLQSCNYQQIKQKYRPDDRLYDQENLLDPQRGQPHILLSSVGVYRGKLRIEMAPVSLEIVRPFSYVLRKILTLSPAIKKPPSSPP